MACNKCKCSHSISPNYNQINHSSESLSDRHGSHLCTIRRSNVLLSFYLPFYLLYLVAGAFIFNLIEQDAEFELRRSLREHLAAFKDSHPCITGEELETLIIKVMEAKQDGVSATNNATGESMWSFGQSLFFASTIVTTIGYGSTHPLTAWGKIFCIAFAIIGIPLTFILLAALVERLLIPITWFQTKFASRFGDSTNALKSKILILIIVGTISVLLFLIIPAFIFATIEEGWHFLDALYYCFISLTTIGLGDYTPGDNVDQPFRALYKICTTGYLLIGLTFMMLLLHLFNDIPQLNVGHFLLRKSDQQRDPERMHLNESMEGTSSRKYSIQETDTHSSNDIDEKHKYLEK